MLAALSLATITSARVITGDILPQDLQQRVLQRFKDATTIGPFDLKHKVWPVQRAAKIIGYVFQTNQQVSVPAYSGKPVNLLLTIDRKGNFKDAWVLEQHEPILLVGIPPQKLYDFTAQYPGKSLKDRIRVAANKVDGQVNIDGITGATVTAMVVNETILRSAFKVAVELGLVAAPADRQTGPAVVKQDLFVAEGWNALIKDGTIRSLHLTRAEVDQAFQGTKAEHLETAAPNQKADTFIDLYYTYLNAPTAGRNLLGERQFKWLMSLLKPGEQAIAVLGRGIYSFKGSGYVRGGIFDRINITQGNNDTSFRDLDYYRLNDIFATGHPKFHEMAIFIIRKQAEFDPGLPWQLNLLIKRSTGALGSVFVSFSGKYRIPEKYIVRPKKILSNPDKDQPLWISVWQQRIFQITVVSISLLLLLTVIFLQEWLVRFPHWLHTFRRIFLIYTVTFVGWYSLGQLSVVNVFTFSHALMGNFRWQLFLLDPVVFILWAFTAATVLMWGRGIFCGWLCPFGALQELINELARKLKIRQFDLPFSVHEKLWALKYMIFLGLFAVSLQSMSSAEKLAEVEPFKTTILLVFQRQWWFVTYALALLFMSIFTRKVYCRYLCPLGAALAIPTKLRLFDWLKRRPECGDPCQLCARECEIRAIHPNGEINANECHHCLDCQVTYHDDQRCPPLVNRAKHRNKRMKSRANATADIPVSVAYRKIE